MRRFILALALIAVPILAFAQTIAPKIPTRSVPVAATSGNVANATATATLAAPTDGTLNYVCGFSVTSLGATAAATVTLTITGTAGTWNYSYFTVAGATTANQLLVLNFAECLPASAPNTAIAVSLPALGAGNTNANVNAWGYRF